MNNPLKYTDPSGYIFQGPVEPEAPYWTAGGTMFQVPYQGIIPSGGYSVGTVDWLGSFDNAFKSMQSSRQEKMQEKIRGFYIWRNNLLKQKIIDAANQTTQLTVTDDFFIDITYKDGSEVRLYFEDLTLTWNIGADINVFGDLVESWDDNSGLMDAASQGGGNGPSDEIALIGAFGGSTGKGAQNILDNRGAYMPRKQIYTVNKPVTVRTPVVNINTTSKVLNYTRVGGKALGVVGVAATGYQVYNDFDNGNYYSAGARTLVAGIALGATAIPVAGWGVAIGIGVLDYMYGDDFYNWVETKMGD